MSEDVKRPYSRVISSRAIFLTCFLQLNENIKYQFPQFLNLFNSRATQTGSNYTACSRGSVGVLTVLIYILMLKNNLRGKEECSLVLVMKRQEKKVDRKAIEKLQAKWSGFIFSVIISNYPPVTVIRYYSNGGFAQSFILPKMTILWLSVFNKRPIDQS